MIQDRAQSGYGVNKGSYGDVRTLCKAGHLKEALHILNKQGTSADSYTYVCLLRECIRIENLKLGKQVHSHIIQSGFKPNLFLLNALVNMYAKCGSLADARQVFDKIGKQDMFTWNIMIAGYAKHGCGRQAFELYQQMIGGGVTPNKVTFICVLKACASLAAFEMGKLVHADIIKAGMGPDVNLETALADMYAKCRSMKDAQQVFDNMAQRNVVSWSVMIAGYAQNGSGIEAFEMYAQMVREGFMPNKVTFVCVLNACSSLGAMEKGKEIHAAIIKAGIGPDLILDTALVDMYSKCGNMKDARLVFDSMAKQDVVTWSAMITGYVQHGCGMEAFEMYEQMIRKGVTPDKITFICALNACASLAALEMGKEVHSDTIKSGIAQDFILETALVDMYAKCGNMKDARQVFDNMAKRDVVSWSAMITGYAQHGCGREALQLFERMQQEGLTPNAVSFVSVLSACSHMGLVDEGCHYFESMSQAHGLNPTLEHFGCMVDLFGRAGRLDEAEDLIDKMSVEPGALLWKALLGACRIHGNLEVSERVAKRLLNWDPLDGATGVLLQNIYAAASSWDDTAKVTK